MTKSAENAGIGAIESLFHMLTASLLERLGRISDCDHTLRHTRTWLRECHPDQEEQFVAFLRQLGRYCDCQVLTEGAGVLRFLVDDSEEPPGE